MHGLSDFEAVQELRCDLRRKAACGLVLYDIAFDPSLRTHFRRRLRHSTDPMRIFPKVKEVVDATGVLKDKQRCALASAVPDDAVATRDTVTQIMRTTTPTRANTLTRATRRSPGTTGRRAPRWSMRWSPTRSTCSDTCLNRNWARGRRTRWACWPWSPGRTWNRPRTPTAVTAAGCIAPRAAPATATASEGCKGHVSFEPESGLFAAVAVTGGYGPGSHEAAVARDLLDGEDGGSTVLGDCAHGTGELRESRRPRATPAAGTATCPGRTHRRPRPDQSRRRPHHPVQTPVRRLPAPCTSAAPPPRQDAPSTSIPSMNRRPPTADRRPPTADRRPPTADRRPPTADRRPPRRRRPDPARQAEYRRSRPPVRVTGAPAENGRRHRNDSCRAGAEHFPEQRGLDRLCSRARIHCDHRSPISRWVLCEDSRIPASGRM
ncbi:transposase [Streptomyces blattellae]|uniref:transposase n=1 Tax=Streptomyces blattellae TaxID=2569855 RepID=UPI0012B8C37C